ncbi:hypothetical protein Trydic_g8046 [Trypoxylus dichotomus]
MSFGFLGTLPKFHREVAPKLWGFSVSEQLPPAFYLFPSHLPTVALTDCFSIAQNPTVLDTVLCTGYAELSLPNSDTFILSSIHP